MQKPLWCEKYSADSCSNREYYFLGQLPYLTSVESLVYEVTLFFIRQIVLHFNCFITVVTTFFLLGTVVTIITTFFVIVLCDFFSTSCAGFNSCHSHHT